MVNSQLLPASPPPKGYDDNNLTGQRKEQHEAGLFREQKLKTFLRYSETAQSSCAINTQEMCVFSAGNPQDQREKGA